MTRASRRLDPWTPATNNTEPTRTATTRRALWAVDAQGFLVQFSGGPAPEHLLAQVDRVDAAAAWAEENCPAWFNDGPPRLHAFSCNGELPTYTRNGVPAFPLRLSDAPAVIADVAALVEMHRAVGDTWTVHLDDGWV